MQLNSRFFELKFPSDVDLKRWVTQRDGETRLGQTVCFRATDEIWKSKLYHILGIQEDIGPQLNNGMKGCDAAFEATLPKLLAMQSNRFLNGNSCCIHGTINLIKPIQPATDVIDDLDSLVTDWCRSIQEIGGIPIVIGGGHNNAFGLINGVSQFLKHPISVINLDPHADTRALEGRHSGNPFSYAFEAGSLNKYVVLGLHQSYNNEQVLKTLDRMKAQVTFFESWIDDSTAFENDLDFAFETLNHSPVGIELDMDSIAYMPSSAFTPSGISVEQARFYVRKMAQLKNVQYIHFPEAAPQNESEKRIVGKTLAYLISDFIKVHSNSHTNLASSGYE